MMRAVVTGGAGFIGQHLIEALLAENYQVAVLDNLSGAGDIQFPKGVKLYQYNIEDPLILDVLKKEQPDYLFHLAAQVSVQKSMEDPYADLLANVVGTVNLLQHCITCKVKK
ncbi:hypothetical protein CD798_03230 [Bacillaceae bacterium SAOS 7]|nr:hypothetical protein CD798_03230 [Bacillaceae bacterium SAOS 7]